MERGSGVLAIRYLVAAGDSLTPLESLLNRWHPGRVRQLLRRRQFDGKSERQAQDIGWIFTGCPLNVPSPCLDSPFVRLQKRGTRFLSCYELLALPSLERAT